MVLQKFNKATPHKLATLNFLSNFGLGGANISGHKGDAEAIVGDIVGIGGNIGVDLVSDPDTKSLVRAMKNKGGNLLKNAGAKLAASSTGSKLAGRLATQVAKSSAQLGTKLATQAAVSASMGPIGWALLVVQIAFGLIDMLWDPWKNYFNKDLNELKQSLDDGLKDSLKETGANWPLEIKPNFFTDTDMDEFQKLVKQYYDDNGLIQKEEALAEEENMAYLEQIRRTQKLFTVDDEGNIDLSMPVLKVIDINNQTQQSLATLIASAAAIKKGYTTEEYRISKRTESLMEYERPWYHSTLKYIKSQWTSIVISIVCLILSSLSIILSVYYI